MNRALLDYLPEMELAPAPPSATSTPAARPAARAEAKLLPRSATLLELSGPGELDIFLGELVDQAAQAGRQRIAPALKRGLVVSLRGAAQLAFPATAGQAPLVASSALAARRAADLKSRAARLFGLELEGLSPEDKEFALAQHFIRFANATIANALAERAGADAPGQAQRALMQAARRYAPGLLGQEAGAMAPRHGRWHRAGDRIIVLQC